MDVGGVQRLLAAGADPLETCPVVQSRKRQLGLVEVFLGILVPPLGVFMLATVAQVLRSSPRWRPLAPVDASESAEEDSPWEIVGQTGPRSATAAVSAGVVRGRLEGATAAA